MVRFLEILTLLGLADSAYLLWRRYGPRRRPLVCPFNQRCDVVLESKYGALFGVRNEVIGVAYYLFMLVLLAGRLLIPAFWLSLLALIVSMVLTGIQHFVLKNYCSYCLFANLINAILFFGVASRLYAASAGHDILTFFRM